jgi:hypothetical protein
MFRFLVPIQHQVDAENTSCDLYARHARHSKGTEIASLLPSTCRAKVRNNFLVATKEYQIGSNECRYSMLDTQIMKGVPDASQFLAVLVDFNHLVDARILGDL